MKISKHDIVLFLMGCGTIIIGIILSYCMIYY